MATITVDTLTDSLDADDGLTSLREAVALANADPGADLIVFATGGTVALDAALGEIEILAPLGIDGGGAVTLDGGGASRLLLVNDEVADTALVGLTLTGGNGAGQINGGGAIHSIAPLTLERVTLTGNATTADAASGGAVRVVGDLRLVDSTLTGNATSGQSAKGGAAFATGTLTVEGGTISGNTTSGTYAGGGGLAANGAIAVTGATVSDNTTRGDSAGGGGLSGASTVTLEGATVAGNATTGASSNGGGIYALGSVSLVDSTVGGLEDGAGNTTAGANAVGGGIAGRADVTVSASAVLGNATTGAGAKGGGIYASNALLITGGEDGVASLVAANATAGADAQGGGVFAALSATVDGTAFEDNATAGYRAGGGALHANGALSITASSLTGNATAGAYAAGGALYGGQAVSVEGTYLSANATAGDGSGGGAISAGGALALRDSTLSANQTSGSAAGGGAVLARSDATLANLTVEENATLGENAPGGAIRSFGALEIARSTLSANRTEGANSPGGALSTDGPAALSAVVVANNATAGSNAGGGGVDANGELRLADTAILDNATSGAAAPGGGLEVDGPLWALRSTVGGNATAGDGARGGGIDADGDATLVMVTLAGNLTSGAQADGGGLRVGGIGTLVGLTATGNQASGPGARGGAVFADGDLAIGNALILGNAVSGTGGAGTGDLGLGAGEEALTALGPYLLGTATTTPEEVFAQTAPLQPGSAVTSGVLGANGGLVPSVALRVDGSNPALDAGDAELLDESSTGRDLDGDGGTADVFVFDTRGGGFLRRIDLAAADIPGRGPVDLGAVELGTLARPPAAADDMIETGEDVVRIEVDALSNDLAGTGSDLRIVSASVLGGAGGTVRVASDGTRLVYEADGAFDGLGAEERAIVRLAYRIEDETGAGDDGLVEIVATGENARPVARDDTVSVPADGGVARIDVLANDTDPDAADSLTVTAIDAGGIAGRAAVASGGTEVRYDPTGAFGALGPGASAIETLTYTIADGSGTTAEARLTITVIGTANLPPVARDDGVSAEPGALVAIDVLADHGAGADRDPDGGAVTVSDLGSPDHGLAMLSGEGQVLYRSAPGFAGTDSFAYRIEDADGLAAEAHVTVEVAAPSTARELPLAEAQRVAALFEAALDRDGDLVGLNFWIDSRAGGESLAAIAGEFLAAPEFTERFGAAEDLDDLALTRQLYRNILDREGDDAGVSYWTGELAAGFGRENLLIAFADSPENLANAPELATLDEATPGDWAFL